jgi:hypothetical protein
MLLKAAASLVLPGSRAGTSLGAPGRAPWRSAQQALYAAGCQRRDVTFSSGQRTESLTGVVRRSYTASETEQIIIDSGKQTPEAA